jgi:hypothetical protein
MCGGLLPSLLLLQMLKMLVEQSGGGFRVLGTANRVTLLGGLCASELRQLGKTAG